MGQLDDYLKRQLAAGYTYEQLQSVLLDQGYTQEEIQASYSNIENTQYEQQLSAYIKEQLQSGAKPALLEQQLIDQGYTPGLVRKLLYPHHSLSHHHIITFLILLVLAIGITLVVLELDLFESGPVETPVRPTPTAPEPSTAPTTSPNSPQLVEAQQTDTDRYLLARQRGLSDQDCESYTDSFIRDSCWRAYSLEVEVPARCEQISSRQLSDACYRDHLDAGRFVECSNFELPRNLYSCQQVQLS